MKVREENMFSTRHLLAARTERGGRIWGLVGASEKSWSRNFVDESSLKWVGRFMART